jgi:hypothetical protein
VVAGAHTIEIDKAVMATAQNASGQMKKHKCEYETLGLSDRDREVFFEALIDPTKPSERLARALAAHKWRGVVGLGAASSGFEDRAAHGAP